MHQRHLHLLQPILAPLTLRGRVVGLHRVARALAPAEDWRWLARVVARLDRNAHPLRRKQELILPADELFAAGLRLMAAVEVETGSTPRMRAHRYRNGLLLAFLAAWPFRAGNFVVISLRHHLHRDGPGWVVEFEPAETKNRQSNHLQLPDGLIPGLERYLGHWRPRLLGAKASDRLWLSWRGGPISVQDLRLIVRQVTQACFGRPIHPHLFRDCLATHVAIHAPQRARIIAPLLGHDGPTTAHEHYIHAGPQAAAAALQAHVLRLRRAARRRRAAAEG